MNGLGALGPTLHRLQRQAAVVGALLLAACLVAGVGNPAQFFQSYLEGYLFWLGVALGCLAVVMIHHLVGGRWGLPVRRLLEAGSRTLPLLAVLFLPFLLGMRTLYAWARPDVVAADPALQAKQLYLNVPGFWVRAVIYFAIWVIMALCLNKWSREQDATDDRRLAIRMKILSGPGILLYGLTITFASMDWVMSLEPTWHSTMYGMIFMTAHGLQGFAFVIIACALLSRGGALAEVARPAQFQDLGNLTLTCLMLWTYTAFSQFLIIWAENLVDEAPWYLHRTAGGWQGVALALIVLQFALPFALLLSRVVKRSALALSLVAVGILVMQWVSLVWLVAPAFHPDGLYIHWMDFATPLGVGGIWLAVFLRGLMDRPLLPLHDPRFAGLPGAAGEAR
jgi:hypothetical protein